MIRELTKYNLETLQFVSDYGRKKKDFFTYLRQIYKDNEDWIYHINIVESICQNADNINEFKYEPEKGESSKMLYDYIEWFKKEMGYRAY